jgi:uncharacterized protein
MSGIAAVPSYVIMQPTTLCNLDCTYCYLPLRAVDRAMSPSVAAAVAATVNHWVSQRPFSVVWHGGEPLAAGRDRLAELIRPFAADVDHVVQTNATLIDDRWCEFVAKHGIRIGVSVDGPATANLLRLDRNGQPAYDRIMRGIARLRAHGIAFSVLCVVSDPRSGLAAELYDFFCGVGCEFLGVNIEEQEGVNHRSNDYRGEAVQAFWTELVDAWRGRPVIAVREIEWTLRYLGAELAGNADAVLPRRLDPIPTVGYDGSVVLLSPELAGFSDSRYGDFSAGNVLESSLAEIVTDATRLGWVAEYLTGVEACRSTCGYFGFCGGGHPSNRYFEHGRFDGTRTRHCDNSKIRLMEGMLDHARRH